MGLPVPRPPSAPSRGANTVVIGVAVAALIVSVGWWVMQQGGSSPPPDDVAAQAPAPSAADIEREKALEVARAREQELALSKVDQQRAVDLGLRARRTFEGALAEADRWTTQVEPLLTNEDGRILAASDDRTESFSMAYAARRPGREEIESQLARLEALLRPLRVSLEDPRDGSRPAPGLVASLEASAQEAEAALTAYKGPRERIEGVLFAARQAGASPGAATLEQSLATLRARRATAEATEALRRDETHRQELAAAAAKEAQAQAQAEAERLARDGERQRLLAEAADPTIQQTFAVFVSKGHWVIGAPNQMHRTDVPMAGSYKNLRRFRILDDYESFLNAVTGSYNWNNNDRPTWPRPRTEAEQELYQQRFAQLRRLAPVWAETGVLAP